MARIVDVVCWDQSEQKVGGQGSRTNRYAIDFLANAGVLKNLDCTWARTVRCDWAREDWRHDDGFVSLTRDQEAVDNILFMAHQHIGLLENGSDNGLLDVDSRTTGRETWIDALAFMAGIGVIIILGGNAQPMPQINVGLPEKMERISPLADPRTCSTIQARIVDTGYIDRRYPPTTPG